MALTASSGGGGNSGSEPASVTGVAVVSSAGADKTYGLGDTIQVRATPRRDGRRHGLAAAEDQDWNPRWGEFWAGYESGSGTSALTLAYTVAEPNTAPSGIAVLANTLELNGGTIRSGAPTPTWRTRASATTRTTKVDWRKPPEGRCRRHRRKERTDAERATFDGGASASFSITERCRRWGRGAS